MTTKPKAAPEPEEINGIAWGHDSWDGKPVSAQDEMRAAYEASNQYLDYTRNDDAWGRPQYYHSHIQIGWEQFQAGAQWQATRQAATDLDIAANRSAGMAVFHDVPEAVCAEIAEAVRATPQAAPSDLHAAIMGHTIKEDFEHFLSYSGLHNEVESVREKLFIAFEANWTPSTIAPISNEAQPLPQSFGEFTMNGDGRWEEVSDDLMILEDQPTVVLYSYDALNDARKAAAELVANAAPAPFMDESIDREKLLWCARTVRAIADLGRAQPLGDWYGQAVTVAGTLRGILGLETIEPVPAQTAVAVPPEVTNALARYNAGPTNAKAFAIVCIVEDWLELLAAHPQEPKP